MSNAEIIDSVRILKGPPIPALLPSKGVGLFREKGQLSWYVLSRFNESDTTVRTPVTWRNAFRLFWNLLRNR